jgi:hypothetical protein
MTPTEGMETAQTRLGEIEVRSIDGLLLRGRWWGGGGGGGGGVVGARVGGDGGGY